MLPYQAHSVRAAAAQRVPAHAPAQQLASQRDILTERVPQSAHLHFASMLQLEDERRAWQEQAGGSIGKNET
jgi:hypothetical protein